MSARAEAGYGFDELLSREWLVTNGLGSYASSSVPGLNTRKYHGLLVAAMSPPTRRMVLLSRVEETVYDGQQISPLACSEYPGTIFPSGYEHLRAFSSGPRPRWAYQGDGWTIDKELHLLPGSNTVLLTYTYLAGDSEIELQVRPMLALRGIHELSFQWNGKLEAVPFDFALESAVGRAKPRASCLRIAPTSRTPELFFGMDGKFVSEPYWYLNTIYRRERERGYAGLEDVWSPGTMNFKLRRGQRAHLICSTEPVDVRTVVAESDRLAPVASKREPAATVAISSDGADVPAKNPSIAKRPEETLAWLQSAVRQFLPASHVEGPQQAPSFFATSYPWSPPSIRDALISYTGLFLLTDSASQGLRFLEAVGQTLRSDGLIANRLPEDGSEPIYDGADTALWFINAVQAHARYTEDGAPSEALFRICARIVERCRAGTELGIRVGVDGTIWSRSSGIGTSWMDAKVGDWVITGRQGRPIELNALWYNALRIVGRWCAKFDQSMRGEEMTLLADTLRASFNKLFWHEHAGCCFDVVGENVADASIRPNQLLAISLPFAVLDESRHASVLRAVRSRLLTPHGVRTLAPEDPSYQGRYAGDVVTRDRAYHQGSAYPWLLGPYVTALLKSEGRTPESLLAARDALSESIADLATGTPLCELYDGDLPQHCGGGLASLRSAAEILRCYCEDVLGLVPEAKRDEPKEIESRK